MSLVRLSLLSLFAVTTFACAAAHDGDVEPETEAAIDEELTSATALSRTLTFQGVVYVNETASDVSILSTGAPSDADDVRRAPHLEHRR